MRIASIHDTGYNIKVYEGYIVVEGEPKYFNIVHDEIDNRFNLNYSDVNSIVKEYLKGMIIDGSFVLDTSNEYKDVYLKAIKNIKDLKCTPRFDGKPLEIQ